MPDKHQNLPGGHGNNYVKENIYRALEDLCRERGRRDRIINACENAHRPNDNEFFTGYMSDETLHRWRECNLSRYQKSAGELSDEEIDTLAEALIAFILSGCRDLGLAESGLDPKEFNMHGSYHVEDLSSGPPRRNEAAQ
jgi:hypothetical protein